MTMLVIDENRLESANDMLAGQQLGLLSEFIHDLREDGIAIVRHHDIWNAVVAPSVTITEAIFNRPGFFHDEDQRLLLMAQLSGMVEWDAASNTISSYDYAASEARSGHVAACVVIPIHEGTIGLEGGSILHLLGSEPKLIEFYRYAPELGNLSEVEFIANAERAYPNLHFHKDLRNQIGNFELAYEGGLRKQLAEALADLNDKLPLLLDTERDLRNVAKQFSSQSDYEISPESPQTHKNGEAMKLRNVKFKCGTHCCEWHLKLRPHIDRIHFYFGDHTEKGKRVLIGKFCDHLPT